MSYFKPINNFKLDVDLSRKMSGLTPRQYFEKHMPHLSKEKIDEHVAFIESVGGYETGLITVPRPMSYDAKANKLTFRDK